MDHDALNRAYDDEISRLFRELLHADDPATPAALKQFDAGVRKADAAWDAVNEMWRKKTAGMGRLGQ